MNSWIVAPAATLDLRAGDPADAGKMPDFTNTLKVHGTGVVRATPDTIRASLKVLSRSDQPKIALEAVRDTINTILARTTDLEFISNTVVLSSTVSVEPVYVNNDVVAYQGQGVVRLESPDAKDLSTTTSILLKDLPKVTITDQQWLLRNSAESERKALSLAGKNAASLAETLSKSLGVTLDKIVGIESRGVAPDPSPVYRSRSLGGDDQTSKSIPLVPDKVNVTASVMVTYAISDKLVKIGRTLDEPQQPVFLTDIETETLKNEYYRKVLFTTKQQQLVVMCLIPGEIIPLEIHDNMTQFMRVEQGVATVETPTASFEVPSNSAVTIPSEKFHKIYNNGKIDLKLYVVYSSDNGKFEHEPNAIEIRQPK